jgi:hypothetical protein
MLVGTTSQVTSASGSALRDQPPVQSIVIDESRTYSLNIALPGENAKTYLVDSRGNPFAERVLFPELAVDCLTQQDVDATQYEQAFAALPAQHKLAVRQWTMTECDVGRYSDGSLNLLDASDGNEAGSNYDLNRALAHGAATPQQVAQAQLLSSALSALPSRSGEYFRVAEYRLGEHNPWIKDIDVGSIVSNSPCFMSVSDGLAYAREAAAGNVSQAEDAHALVFFNISEATSCTPLLKGVASLCDENEHLFDRDACFRVLGIAVANMENGTANDFPLQRIGVLLEEVRSDSGRGPVHNIHTGRILGSG